MQSSRGAVVGGCFGGFLQWICGAVPVLECDLIKLQGGFVGVAVWCGCSPVGLLHSFQGIFS